MGHSKTSWLEGIWEDEVWTQSSSTGMVHCLIRDASVGQERASGWGVWPIGMRYRISYRTCLNIEISCLGLPGSKTRCLPPSPLSSRQNIDSLRRREWAGSFSDINLQRVVKNYSIFTRHEVSLFGVCKRVFSVLMSRFWLSTNQLKYDWNGLPIKNILEGKYLNEKWKRRKCVLRSGVKSSCKLLFKQLVSPSIRVRL